MSEEWKSRAQKPADFCWGTCLGISRGVPEVWARLAYVSFLPHDLVTGWIPHTGFRQLPTSVFWPGEFHGLHSPMGSQRVRHDWATFTHSHSLTLPPAARSIFLWWLREISLCCKWATTHIRGVFVITAITACQCRRHKRHGFYPWVGKIPWRREWQPTPVLLPGKFHGQRSLAGYSPWGCKESDRTEHTHLP